MNHASAFGLSIVGLPAFVAAVLAVEKHAFRIDQDRKAGVFFVTPASRALRTLGFLVAVPLVSNNDPKVR
jgi:hypothetical protein